jgi:hypothetical protein
MKRKSILGKLSLIAFLAVATQSCKKENGIDNNNVIKRPYALFSADAAGNLYKSNDGNNYSTVFPGDGVPLRSIITSKANILIVKDQAIFISENDGKSFNPIKKGVVTVPPNIKWPYFVLDVPQLNRIYISNLSAGDGKTAYSPENGTYFDSDTNFSKKDFPYLSESFTYLDNQILFSFSPSGSANGISKLFYKVAKDKAWEPQPTDLPSPHNFYLSHSGNRLIATDYEGSKGAFYSDDTGKTFKAYNGLPTTATLYCTHASFGKILIGTQSGGVYVCDANANTFSPSNGGLPANTTVYSVVGKDNIYKNDVSKRLFYIATNNGIYRSEDLAKSWVRVKIGDHRLVY